MNFQTSASAAAPPPPGPGRGRPFASTPEGFTLLEILVAVVILAVGILGVTAMQTASLTGQVLARNTDSALSVASDALDRLQANSENIGDYIGGDYGGAFTVTTSTSGGSPSGERPSATVAGADYDALYASMVEMSLVDAQLTVTLQNDVPISGVDTAVATVTWTHKGDQKQCKVTSVIFRE